MSGKCLIFTTDHRKRVAEVRVIVSDNAQKNKEPKLRQACLAETSWLAEARSFLSQHVP